MAGYRLNDRAIADLDRLYEHGILTLGLQRADEYYDGLARIFHEAEESPDIGSGEVPLARRIRFFR